MPTGRMSSNITQDWEPVVLRRAKPKAADLKSAKAVNQALRSGAQGETTPTTYESVGGGENRTRTDLRSREDQGNIQIEKVQNKAQPRMSTDAGGYGYGGGQRSAAAGSYYDSTGYGYGAGRGYGAYGGNAGYGAASTSGRKGAAAYGATSYSLPGSVGAGYGMSSPASLASQKAIDGPKPSKGGAYGAGAYGSGAGGHGDRFGGSDRFASRYADDRYDGGHDRYPPAADRFSGVRYGRWRYGMQSGGRVNITSVADKDSQTFRVKMSVDDWKRWCKFKEFLETGKATTYAISANFHGHTSLTTGCETDDKSWLIDSGASRHMVGSYHNFVDYVPDVRRQSVKLADGSSQTVMGSGSVICGPNMSLSSVLHVPSFPINLLSISCITKELNCAVIFFPSWCLFQELGTGRWLGTGNMRDGLYYLDDNVSAMVAAAISQSPLQEFMLLHRRLGHMSFRTLGKLYPNLFNKVDKEKLVCDACEYGKLIRSSYLLSDNRSAEPFQTIHSDVWGPSGVWSLHGYKSFVTFIDCCTRTTWVYVLRHKSDVFECFKDFHNLIMTQYDARVKIFRTDNGTEYLNKQFDEYLSSFGIIHQTSCPNTSQQNGLAERKNRHLLEITRCIMLAMNVPKYLWSEAVMTAAYLINRMPSRVLNNKTPIECLTGKNTYIVPPKVFGCVCFVRDHRPSVGKLDPRAMKCIFVGYSGKQKGYKCWCPSEKRMFVSMDVVFREHEPYYGEPVDLTNVFPDLYVDDAIDLDNETGGDKGEEEDSDVTSQEMIIGVIPRDNVQDDRDVIDPEQEVVQEEQQGDRDVIDAEQEVVQEEQQEESNDVGQWPKPNEEREVRVYTRRQRIEEKRVQEQEHGETHSSDSHTSDSFDGDDEPEITRLKKALAKSFEVKDLGFLHYFLGIEVAYGAQADNKIKMAVSVVLLISVLSAIVPLPSEALNVRGHLLKSKTFRSPPIILAPGSVSNKYYPDVDFPHGHIAIKSFDAEVVDENGVPVPLHETYLHHWVTEPYYALKNSHSADSQTFPKGVLERNDGVCKTTLGQYFGLGSETRHTATWVPDPYGIEAGNPEKTPEGYEEKWMLNIHAIDTRGVLDKPGCTECKCDFYNVTIDEYGRTIPKNYTGGLYCCYDQTQCLVKEGFNGGVRKLFLQYKVTWLDWTDAVVPVKIYIFDVTDTALLDGIAEHSCKVEYQVEECSAVNRANNDCVHVKTVRAVLPHGGDIVYGVAHQHSGGIGSSLHGQDGRLLCESLPTYGTGQEAGNEENYIVGMSTCYPKPGSIKVSDGEVLTVVSNYSSDRQHTGVMGLFYILVAEPQQPAPAPSLCFSFPAKWCLPAWISSNM